jgi:hypothetical protein
LFVFVPARLWEKRLRSVEDEGDFKCIAVKWMLMVEQTQLPRA